MTLSWTHICGDLGLVRGGSLHVMLALFLAGLGGSVTHCLTMCSTFVLGQRPGGSSLIARLLLPYHAGRVTTYVALGALAGIGFGAFSGSGVFPVIRHLVLALVAVLFLSILAERLLQKMSIRLPFRLGVGAGCAIKTATQLRSVTKPVQRYGLGMALGLLPCPLVLAALMTAATTAGPVRGGLAMLAFGLGTMPALTGLAFARGNLLNFSPKVRDVLTLAALALNSVILLTLAVGTGASGA